MKTSDLITLLQAHLNEHGDCEIGSNSEYEPDVYGYCYEKVTEIELDLYDKRLLLLTFYNN